MTAIFFIATIILLLSLDWVVQRLKKGNITEPAPAPRSAAQAGALRLPEGIFFAKSHTWLNLFPSGKVRLGVGDFIGSLLENPRISFSLRSGQQVEKGDPLLVIEDGDRRITVRSPLAGEILTVNEDLAKNPQLMRKSLFSEGWAYSIRPRRLEELRSMLIGEETRAWMSTEFGRLRDLLAAGAAGAPVPVTLQDGGAPAPGLLKRMDDAKLQQFDEQFLQVR